jgi:hypothetical protein
MTTRFKTNKPRNTQHTANMKTIDSIQQETPTQSEENNQFIQHPYDTLGRSDRDALFASRDAGDPQERDRRVWRSMIFTASTGMAMIVAATFATVLEYSGFWQDLWLAICIGFTVLFFVGLFRFGSDLSSKSWRNAGYETWSRSAARRSAHTRDKIVLKVA